METWLLRVGESGEAAAAGAQLLDEDETRRLAATRHPAGRLRYLAAHVGLRMLLGARLGEPPERIRFRREPCPGCGGPHGRPALDMAGGPHFSMAHSGDAVLYALASAPVGVDVESPSARHARFDLTSYLHPGEQRAIAALPGDQRPSALLSCWVRKEAYLKGTGEGLAAGIGRTYVGLGGCFAVLAPAPTPEGWQLLDVDVPEGYAAAVAIREDGASHPAIGIQPLRPKPLHLG